MKNSFPKILVLFASLALSCQAVGRILPVPDSEASPLEEQADRQLPEPTSQSGDEAAVLLFSIGMHIEPLGETAQGFKSGKGNYNAPGFFKRHVEDIDTLAAIVESHGGAMTIQAQSPFTTAAIEAGETLLENLAARGHEIALHFHEDAHLGDRSESLATEQWCSVMKEEIDYIEQSSGVRGVRFWSGGNLSPQLFEAAACAGLDVNSDWKNPKTQTTDLALVGVNPWRPSGGTDGNTFSDFITHDPEGAVIFLPEGQYDQEDFAASRRSDDMGGDQAYFDYLAESLYASLDAADPAKVNVFHFTVHPGEFRGNPGEPFKVIDRFLSEIVDPLVAEGRLQWATFSQMADAYILWEQSTSTPGNTDGAASTHSPGLCVQSGTPQVSALDDFHQGVDLAAPILSYLNQGGDAEALERELNALPAAGPHPVDNLSTQHILDIIYSEMVTT